MKKKHKTKTCHFTRSGNWLQQRETQNIIEWQHKKKKNKNTNSEEK